MAEFKSITKKYGNDTVLENFSLTLEKNSPIVMMGESGRGKTTLLRIAAGLEKADSGEFISVGERIAYMFQEPRLMPWKNALDNVRAPLPKNAYALADKYFSAVGLEITADGRKLPNELSGGMAQRVAFAKFLAFAEHTNATLLLLDEPFSALDDETAKRMSALLKGFSDGKTVILVSHDESDAEELSARIVCI